jgi:holin-like protein
MKRLFIILAQIAALLVVNEAGYAVVDALRLPLPGNLVGMLFLLALLVSGLVRLEWVESGALLLIRHLAFFFIPITVGLMGFAQLFLDHGLAILTTLIASAGLGICITGFCSQLLSQRKHRTTP